MSCRGLYCPLEGYIVFYRGLYSPLEGYIVFYRGLYSPLEDYIVLWGVGGREEDGDVDDDDPPGYPLPPIPTRAGKKDVVRLDPH